MTPDAGTSFLLPRAIGLKRSLELLLLNRVCAAPEALGHEPYAAMNPGNLTATPGVTRRHSNQQKARQRVKQRVKPKY